MASSMKKPLLSKGDEAASRSIGAARKIVPQVFKGFRGACMDFVRLEIIRDFIQKIDLFFSTFFSSGLALASKVFGRAFSVVSLQIGAIFDKIPPIYVVIVLLSLAILCTIAYNVIFCIGKKLNPDEIRQGHEVKKWDARKSEQKCTVGFIKWGLRIATLLYLPVSAELAQIFTCGPRLIRVIVYLNGESTEIDCPNVVSEILDDKSNREIIEGPYKFSTCDCKMWSPYNDVVAGAVFVAIFYTISLPIFASWLIYKNKPYGSREDPSKCYDKEGNLTEYTSKRYADDLKNDPNQQNCPYLFLYDGYERKWAYYQVLTMIGKLVLVVPAVILLQRSSVQSIVTLCILGIWAGFSFFSGPFLDPVADRLDYMGHLTSLITVGGSFLSTVAYGDIIGYIILSAHAVNLLVMLLAALWDIEKIRVVCKSLLGRLEFTDSVSRSSMTAKDIVPKWTIPSEVKLRIWQPFWDAVLETEGDHLVKRLQSLLAKTRDVGMDRVLEHWRLSQDPAVLNLRAFLMHELEGVDVYFYGQPSSGNVHLASITCFGKLYLISYPFHGVMVYDDSDDYSFIWPDRVLDLVNQNRDPEIQRRRLVRQKLRALCGPRIHYHMERWETHTVEDGTETYTDSQGNKQTRTVYSTINVLMKYNHGYLSVTSNFPKLVMQAGFKLSLYLDDGYGTGTAPRTGQTKHINNTATLSQESLGINHKFQDCAALKQLFNNKPNADLLPSRLVSLQNNAMQYRQRLLRERLEEEQDLNSAFWLYVYDNDGATLDDLEKYFEKVEVKPEMKDLTNRYKDDLHDLYKRMNFVRSHPCSSIWFIFWSDLWESNKHLKKIARIGDDLDPMNEGSLAFCPLDRKGLEKWLSKHGLLSKFRWISPKTLDMLYEILGVTDYLYKMENTDDEESKLENEEGRFDAVKPSEVPVPSLGSSSSGRINVEESSPAQEENLVDEEQAPANRAKQADDQYYGSVSHSQKNCASVFPGTTVDNEMLNKWKDANIVTSALHKSHRVETNKLVN